MTNKLFRERLVTRVYHRDSYRNLMVIAALVLAFALGLLTSSWLYPLPPLCMEDEAWIAVSYGTPHSAEDESGVNRACVNVEELNLGD